MILPIMVAITAQRARRRAGLLARGLGGARRQPLAHDLARVAAHGAARDRAPRPCSRRRARSARRSCSRWSPAGSPFAANPLDGITFLFEPVQPLGGDDLPGIRGPDDRPGRPHDLRDRGRAARLGGDAVVRRLGRQAAAQALRDRRVMASRRARRAPPTPPAIVRRPREQHLLVAARRPALLLAVLGDRDRAVPDRRRDRAVHVRQGHLLPAPEPVRRVPAPPRCTRPRPVASSTRSSAR